MKSDAILVVTFITVGKGSGPGNAAHGLAKLLHDQGRLAGVICPDYRPDALEIPESLVETPPGRLFQKLLNQCSKQAQRVFDFSDRRFREEVFDFFVSRSRTLRSCNTVVFLKPAFARSVAAANAHGIKTIGWASILHPEFNRRQVAKEDARWGVEFGSSYDNVERARSLAHFFEQLDVLLVPSEVAWHNFQAEGIAKERLRCIPEAVGVDCDRFSPDPAGKPEPGSRPLQALHMSNLNVIKGVGYLLEAWKQAALEGALLRVGGPKGEGIAEMVDKIAAPAVDFIGNVSDTPPRFREADVFISPSLSECMPNTVIESLACGTPVILSSMCGLSGIIEHGIDGFVYDYDDVDALSGHLRWCHEHPVELAEMGRKAREKALRHPTKDFAKHVLAGIDAER